MATIVSIETIHSITNTARYDKVKKNFVVNVYRKLEAAGIKCCILNDLYIELADGTDYQFIHSKANHTYTVKAF